MKLEKEVQLYDYAYDVLDFATGFTKEEREILKQMHHKKVKLTLEVEEPILDEKERKYLSGVIRPFRDKVIGIYKYNSVLSDYEEIAIDTREDYNSNHMTHLPPFKKGTMYKGMELNKEYTLEELGL